MESGEVCTKFWNLMISLPLITAGNFKLYLIKLDIQKRIRRKLLLCTILVTIKWDTIPPLVTNQVVLSFHPQINDELMLELVCAIFSLIEMGEGRGGLISIYHLNWPGCSKQVKCMIISRMSLSRRKFVVNYNDLYIWILLYLINVPC